MSTSTNTHQAPAALCLTAEVIVTEFAGPGTLQPCPVCDPQTAARNACLCNHSERCFRDASSPCECALVNPLAHDSACPVRRR